METGYYKMTGTVRATKTTTVSEPSETVDLHLARTTVDVLAVRKIKHRTVYHCLVKKRKLQTGDAQWWGDWILYNFCLTDKSDVIMTKI